MRIDLGDQDTAIAPVADDNFDLDDMDDGNTDGDGVIDENADDDDSDAESDISIYGLTEEELDRRSDLVAKAQEKYKLAFHEACGGENPKENAKSTPTHCD